MTPEAVFWEIQSENGIPVRMIFQPPRLSDADLEYLTWNSLVGDSRHHRPLNSGKQPLCRECGASNDDANRLVFCSLRCAHRWGCRDYAIRQRVGQPPELLRQHARIGGYPALIPQATPAATRNDPENTAAREPGSPAIRAETR